MGACIFFERHIAIFETLEMSSLSAEPFEGASFVATAFEVDGIVPEFERREEEFDLQIVQYEALDGGPGGEGLLCCRSTDEAVHAKWGDEVLNRFRSHGVNTIWGWGLDSGLRPCPVYARHCLLSAQRLGKEAE